MQAHDSRPSRRRRRPTSIFSAVGSSVTSALLLLATAGVARAADDKAPAAAAAAPSPAAAPADAAAAASASATPTTAAADAAPATAQPQGSTPTVEAKVEVQAGTPPVAAEAAPAPVELPALPGDIARLPPEAYPNDPVRGIYGGSLWLTFHGLQWPYSPFRSEPPRTQLGISGSVWADTSYESLTTENPNAQDFKMWQHQARFTLRATPTYTKGPWFVQGQGELVATNSDERNNMSPTAARTDDLWVRAGRWHKFDVQVGRFLAWEIYHLGMGLDLNTLERQGADNLTNTPPVALYGATALYDRPNGLGNLAAHWYPTRFLRFELLGQTGTGAQTNIYGIRPAGILDFGIVKVKGALEYRKEVGQKDSNQIDNKLRGGGAAVQVVLDPRLELGVNGAYAITDAVNAQGEVDKESSYDLYSVGGFANVRLLEPMIFGLGANYTRKDDTVKDNQGNNNQYSHLQTFAALQVLVLDQLFIKFVAGYAKADAAKANTTVPPWSDKAITARLRLMYLF